MSTRTTKVAHVIQREVSQLFAEALDQHEYGLVTVTRVTVLEDLTEAKVYVSALQNTTGLIEMLNKRRGFVRRTLRPRLKFKKIPTFTFFLDESPQRMARIERLLKQS